MRLFYLIILILLATGVQEARAQAIQLRMEETPLEEGLLLLKAQTGVDIVFAQRLVAGRTVTCHYEGRSFEDALGLLLAGTGLQGERVRHRQYLIVAAPPKVSGASGAKKPTRRVLLGGFVADDETGEVLGGAHVYLPALRVGTVTNDAGYFALPSLPEGGYHVRFSYLGYQPRDTLLAVHGGEALIRLDPTAFLADSVVVEADRRLAALDAVPGLLDVPVQQLEKLPSFPGEQDLFQALQWLPGVRRTGEATGGLVVRGGEPHQNLYLLDGAPVYHPWHAFSLISTFQTETFKDIKLYRGAFPAEYGGRLAAVLDAQMKDGSQAGPEARGALSLLSGRFNIQSPITRTSSFMLSGRRSYLDKLIGREHPVQDLGRRDTLRTGYFFYDFSAKLTYRPNPRHRLALSYYRGRDDLDLRLPFDLTLDFFSWVLKPPDWLQKPPDLFFEVGHDWGNRLYSARYQYLYSRRLFLTTTAYYSEYGAAENAFIVPTSSASVASAYSIKLRDLGVKADVDFYHSISHQMRAGMQVVGRGFRSNLDALVQRSPGAVDSLAQESRLRAFEAVAYVQDDWRPTPRWQIQPGLRASFFSGGSYFRLNPRLNAQYAVDPQRLVLRGSLGSQVQYLQQLRDRFSILYDLVSSRWIPVGKDVKPSSSFQAALGAETFVLPWLTLVADGYFSTADHILLPEDEYQTKDGLEGPGIEVGTLLGQYVEGKGRAYGIELSARAERGPWQVWLSYTGGRSLSRAPALGEAGYRPARFDVPRSLTAVVLTSGRRWSLAVSSELRSGYPHTVPVARYALADPLDETPVRYLYRPNINNGRLPPYFRLDAVAGYRFGLLGARWQARLHLYNLTNRRNVISRTYDPAAFTVQASDRLGLPRLPLFELEMEL